MILNETSVTLGSKGHCILQLWGEKFKFKLLYHSNVLTVSFGLFDKMKNDSSICRLYEL